MSDSNCNCACRFQNQICYCPRILENYGKVIEFLKDQSKLKKSYLSYYREIGTNAEKLLQEIGENF